MKKRKLTNEPRNREVQSEELPVHNNTIKNSIREHQHEEPIPPMPEHEDSRPNKDEWPSVSWP